MLFDEGSFHNSGRKGLLDHISSVGSFFFCFISLSLFRVRDRQMKSSDVCRGRERKKESRGKRERKKE